MRLYAAAFVLALIAVRLLQDVTARKPSMIPEREELHIQEGDELKIECRDEYGGEIKFSTQENMAHVSQSEYRNSSSNDTGWYTFTRPNATRVDTGWYACAEEGIEILNDEQTIDHPESNISWIYVYVNSTKPFAIDTNTRYSDLPYIHIPVVKGRDVVIPCRPTSPNLRVIPEWENLLYELPVSENSSLSTKPEEREVKYKQYDPKIGFVIDEDDIDITQDVYQSVFRCRIDGTDQLKDLDSFSTPDILEYRLSYPVRDNGLWILDTDNNGPVIEAVVGHDLELACGVIEPAAGKTAVLADWDIPESVKGRSRQAIRFIGNGDRVYNWKIWHLVLTIENITGYDGHEYTCVKTDRLTGKNATTRVCVWISQPIEVTVSNSIQRVKVNESALFWCKIIGYPRKNTNWWKIGYPEKKLPDVDYDYDYHSAYLNNPFDFNLPVYIGSVSREDNGTYECTARDNDKTVTARTDLIVTEVPTVNIVFAKAVGTVSVYLNWTVFDGHDPVQHYSIKIMTNCTEECRQVIGGGNSSYVVKGLEKGTAYRFELTANNSIGDSQPAYSELVETLEKDVAFVPQTWIHRTSDTSVTLGMSTPPPDVADLVHYYEIRTTHENETVNFVHMTLTSNHTVLNNLETGKEYSIEVAACSTYTKQCGNWSDKLETIVIDRDPRFVPNVSTGESNLHSIKITWSEPPMEYQQRVHQYKVLATNLKEQKGPFLVNKSENSYVFENLKPKTIHRFKVAACSEYDTQCGNWSSEVEGITDIPPGVQVVPWVVVAIVAILLLSIMAIWMSIRNRRELAARRRFIEAAVEAFRLGNTDCVDPRLTMAEQAELLPYDKKWEFPRNLLIIGKTLGSGAFGTVKKAEAESICKGQKYSTVAVKMVRVTHRLDHMMALQRELKIFAHLGKHLNIVNLLGACTNRISYGELLVIVEYCRFGNLHDYLLRRRADFVDQVDVATGTIAGSSLQIDCFDANNSCTNTAMDGTPEIEECSHGTDSKETSVTIGDLAPDDDLIEPNQVLNYKGEFTDSDLMPIGTRDLVSWAWQVSRGMNYLTSKNVVHADLATRNILLADNNTVKICDFGLAKALYADDIYKKGGNGPLPVKWMAIESIGDRVFSIKSDVWSFGVVLWELFALAKTPYPGIANESVYTKLVDGYRMEKPEYATEQMYQVMLRCWEAEPSNRPSFKELVDILDELLDDRIKDHYVSFDAVYAEINAEELANGKKDYLTMSPSEYASGTNETTV